MELGRLASWIGVWRDSLSFRRRRRRAVLERLPTDVLTGSLEDPTRLRAHLADVTTYDLGLAIGELARRGVDARPTPGALLDLLTSDDERERARGMFLFHAAHPAHGRPPAGEGWSSDDPPEAWRARVARITRPGIE